MNYCDSLLYPSEKSCWRYGVESARRVMMMEEEEKGLGGRGVPESPWER